MADMKNIDEIKKRFEEVTTERRSLDDEIWNYYFPLLKVAGEAGDFEKMDSLISEMPDAPCTMSAYRLEGMYKKKHEVFGI